MSTIWLTVTVSIMLIVGLFLRAAAELYRHRLVVASLLAAAGFAALHLAFIAIAWQAAATVAEEEPYPAVASLPTGIPAQRATPPLERACRRIASRWAYTSPYPW